MYNPDTQDNATKTASTKNVVLHLLKSTIYNILKAMLTEICGQSGLFSPVLPVIQNILNHEK